MKLNTKFVFIITNLYIFAKIIDIEMKKITLVLALFLSAISLVAQENQSKYNGFNRWVVEGQVGHIKGVKPYAPGYYSSKPNGFFGEISPNSFALGLRYMINPTFGLKANFGFDTFSEYNGLGSLPFEMKQIQGSFQGVVNAAQLFNAVEDFGRFGLLFHTGVQVDRMTSKTNVPGHNYDISEWNGGLVVGITPQFRVTKKLALTLDVVSVHNYRQHFNWDGSYNSSNNNLSGNSIAAYLGLSLSLGKQGDIHGDWYKKVEEEKNTAEIDALNERINSLETKLKDTDADGVLDYLDVEPNTPKGNMVDTKGKSIDINKNGVPDNLETYIQQNTSNNTGTGNAIKSEIDESNIVVYFDFDSPSPTASSIDAINLIAKYMQDNPSTNVIVKAYTDVLGTADYNQNLSNQRASNVVSAIISKGISASRLTAKGMGQLDSSKDENSRRLARKATFNFN